jgi:hypothetical protein
MPAARMRATSRSRSLTPRVLVRDFMMREGPSRFLSHPGRSVKTESAGVASGIAKTLEKRPPTRNAEGVGSRRFAVTGLYPPLDADG